MNHHGEIQEQSNLTASAAWMGRRSAGLGCDYSLRSRHQTHLCSVAWDQGLDGFGALKKITRAFSIDKVSLCLVLRALK